MKTHDLAIEMNTLIDGRYRIQEILGEGGFGITYKAWDETLNAAVVVKEYLPNEMGARDHDTISVIPRSNREEDFKYGLEKYLEEARVLAKFNNNNIVRVSNFVKSNGTAYIIMDYAEGITLSDWIKQNDGDIDEDTIINIVKPILQGLSEVHKAGLLHRDIKPGNIFLRENEGPMLIDFGAARHALGEHSKSISAIVSMGYAPPEQYTSRGKQGPWTDLYAIGGVLYKLITGETPIESVDRSHAAAEEEDDPMISCAEAGKGKVSDWLLELTDQLLIVSPKKRPGNTEVVIRAIEAKSPIQDSMEEEVKEEEAKAASAQNEFKTRVIKDDDERFSEPRSKTMSRKVAETAQKGKTPALAIFAIITLVLGGGIGGYYYANKAAKPVAEVTPKPVVKKQVLPLPVEVEKKHQQAVVKPKAHNNDDDHHDDEEKVVSAADIQKAKKLRKKAGHDASHGKLASTKKLLAQAAKLVKDEKGDMHKIEMAEKHHDVMMTVGHLVKIRGGHFKMGDSKSTKNKWELPRHSVKVNTFKVAITEITKMQFSNFVKATQYKTDAEKDAKQGCYAFKGDNKLDWVASTSWRNPGFKQTMKDPVVCISWNDAQAFIKWANKKLGLKFRLLSEAEWEYMARAGKANKKYSFDDHDDDLCKYGNVADAAAARKIPNLNVAECGDGYVFTSPVKRFKRIYRGPYDVQGNVSEWVQDCWNESYVGAPTNGKANMQGECSKAVHRGGSWFTGPYNQRSAWRSWAGRGYRGADLGFRLAHSKMH